MGAAILGLLFLAAGPITAAETSAGRFSGSGELSAPAQQSADQRFAINAEIQLNRTQQSGRFGLTARLLPDAKSISTNCAPLGDSIFRNGFE